VPRSSLPGKVGNPMKPEGSNLGLFVFGAILAATSVVMVTVTVAALVIAFGSINFDTDSPEGPGSGEEVDLSEPEGPGSGEEVVPELPGPGSGDEINEGYFKDLAKASCNLIPAASTCIEYIGSMWANTNAARMRCPRDGSFSTEACPRPTAGGCRIVADSSAEMITWFYNYGGDPITPEVVEKASAACNLSGGMWIFGP
jgi:hypothetical protein